MILPMASRPSTSTVERGLRTAPKESLSAMTERLISFAPSAPLRFMLLLLVALITSFARGAPPGPDNPWRDHWWLRNTTGPGRETGVMNSAMREMADAFGTGRFDECRGLAHALLETTDDPALRDQAATYVIQSHLAEGDFESARAEAQRFGDEQFLARVNKLEADYKAEVSGLQHIVATTDDPAQASRAQLLTARAHQRAGRLDLAAEVCRYIIAQRPDDPIAGDALSQLVNIYLQTQGRDSALRATRSAFDAHADSAVIVRSAIRTIASTYLAAMDTSGALRSLRDLAESTPDPLVRQEAAVAVIDATYAHLLGPRLTRPSNLNDAITYASWALSQLPEGPARTKAHFHLAWYRRWSNQPQEACAHIMRALAAPDLDPYTAVEAWTLLRTSLPRGALPPETLAWLAVACERTGDSTWLGHRPSASQDWRQVAQRIEQRLGAEIPDSPWARLAAAHAHLQAQAPDEATVALQALLNHWPGSPEAKGAGIELAPLLTHAGRTSEAADVCRWLLSQGLPADLEASTRQELARARLCGGEEHGEALQHYYQTIAADPSSESAQQAGRAMGDVVADCLGADTAAQLLHWLRGTYPNTPAAAMADYELAQLNSKQSLDVWKAEQYLAVIQQYPGSQAAALAASALRERASELAECLSDLQRRGQHRDVVAHFANLAPYLDSLDQPTFCQAISTLLSSAGYATGLAEEAKPAIAALLRASACRNAPDKMALLYEAQGNLAAQTGSTEIAVGSWQRLLDGYPASESAAHAALQLGDHYLAARKPEEAMKAYRHARRAVQHLSPDQRASAMVGLGLALEALGRFTEATYEYRAAMALAPDSLAAQEAAQGLEWLESPR